MWQRFSERARNAVFYAQDEARKFGEGYVNAEHLLLGILRQADSTGSRLLVQMGIDPDHARAEIEQKVPRGDAPPGSDMVLTPRAKQCIDLAFDEAKNLLDDDFIGTEHLLLGSIREKGLASQVLAKMGASLEAARVALAVGRKTGTLEPSGTRRTGGKSRGGWQRFNEAARHVVFYAQEEAQKHGESYVSTEHLLLGIMREPETTGAQILTRLGANPTEILERLEEQLPKDDARASSDLSLTSTMKLALDMAYDEASSLGDSFIGSEHLLLGLLRQDEIPSCRILARVGVEAERARSILQRLREETG